MPKGKRPRTKERNYAARNFIRSLANIGCWSILPEQLETIRGLVDQYRQTGTLDQQTVRAAFGYEDEPQRPEYRVVDGVAIVPLVGTLTPKPNILTRWFGGTSMEQFTATVAKAVADPQVKAVLILADTPGGSAIGCAEAHAALMKLRGEKKIIGVVHDGIVASAGYFLLSACDQIFLSQSSMGGSIGTVYLHVEMAQALKDFGYGTTVIRAGQYKWAANPYEPLSESGKATLQETVDDYYAQFVGAVATGRGVTPQKVIADFGEGKMWIADKAVAAGLADGIRTLDQVVSELAAGGTPQTTRAATIPQTPETKEPIVNELLIKALVKRGLVAAGASEEECKAALRIFYATTGQKSPDLATDEGQVQAIQDLTAKPAAGTTAGGATTPPATPPAQPAADQSTNPAPVADPKAAERAQLAERTRVQQIRERGRTLGVSQETIDAAVDGGHTVEQVLMQWTEQRSEQEPPLPSARRDVRVEGSAVDAFASAAVEVLADRCGHRAEQGLSAAARPLRRLSMVDMATHALRAQGVRGVEQMEREDIAQMYLEMGGRHAIPSYGSDVNTPGAYPNIFSLLGRKLLDDAHEAAEVTYPEWCAKWPSVPDFHPRTIVVVGKQGELPQWPDGSPIEGSDTAEDVSWISVDRYGDEFPFTPRMMTDDDLGAFADMAMQKQIAHDLTVNRTCVNLLVSNPVLPDGYALFSTEHNNDITGGTGGAPSVAQASLVREKMYSQTDVSGRQHLRVSPSLALLPSQHITAGEQTFLPIPAIDTGRAISADTNINVFRNKIRPIVEVMLDDQATAGARNDWFVFADKTRVKVICYMFQTGFETGKRTSYFDPKTGCRYIQIEGRFGAAVRDFRGVVRNSGGS